MISFAQAWEFQPAINVQEALAIYAKDGAQVHGGIYHCDICGARYTYGSLFRHTTGSVISIGHDCADRLELASDYDNVYREAKRLGLLAIERNEHYAGLLNWARKTRTLVPSLLENLAVAHPIIQDIRRKLISTGCRWDLTPKQISLVVKLATESRQPAEKHVPVPIVDGRQLVQGIVVSTKIQDSDYGSTLKMIVKVVTPKGCWLVYGTAPAKLLDAVSAIDDQLYCDWSARMNAHEGESADDYRKRVNGVMPPERQGLKGHTVSFEAKLSLGNDPHFAFFSRPTKPRLIV